MEIAALFRSVRAIVFDLDGTLVLTDRLKYESYLRAVAQWGRHLDFAFYKTLIGESRRETCQRIVDHLALDMSWTDLAQAREREFQAMMAQARAPVVRAALRFLRAIPRPHYHVGLVSSASMDWIEWVLKRTRLSRHFDSVISGENLPNKPEPDPYLAAIEVAAVTPWDTVVAEDSQAGVESAVRAGARVVAVPNEATRGQDFSRAHVRVDSLDHLIPYL